MKILMVSEGNITYNGRLIELYNAAKKVGDVTLVTIADSENDRLDVNHHIIKRQNNKFKKIIYLIKTFIIAQKSKFDILFIDNTEACMVGLAIIKLLNPKKVILDSRELYLKGEKMSWKMNVLCYFERKVIRLADIHICANKYRADLMKEIYKLSKTPIVFENIRMITEQPEVDNNYSKQLDKENVTRIISTGGLSQGRALPIIKAMSDLGDEFELYILGSGSELELNNAKKLINELKLKNVYLVGRTRRSVMRHFIQKCDIGVVYYGGKNTNEKLCASGKVYEYMQEYKPFIGPNLLPLNDLCDKYMVGECDDSLSKAILKVNRNYNAYQKNVENFIEQIDVDMNNNQLSKNIKYYL
ncbi:hypothetical protein BGM25_03420 [Bacillus sp. FJAT-29953]|nr:hypothetical protein [Bacillus sp. FJAT-29953]